MHDDCLTTASLSLLTFASLSNLIQKRHAASYYLHRPHDSNGFPENYAQPGVAKPQKLHGIMGGEMNESRRDLFFPLLAWEHSMGAKGKWEKTQ